MLSEQVSYQLIGNEMVIFTEEGDSVFTVNESGTVILQALANEISLNQIARQLSQRYGDSLEVCEAVVEEFVESLQQYGLCNRNETA